MPESKVDALKRAKTLGFPESSVKGGEKGHYIIPHGVTDPTAQRAYIHCRDGGGSSSTCAAVAHTIQNNGGKKK